MYATATTRSAPVFGLRREIDRLFEDTFGRGQAGRNEWTPAVDIYETDAELTFVFDVPGIQPEEVEVSAADAVFYQAYGVFRLAVIAQQIYYRYANGQTTNEAYAVFGPAVQVLDRRLDRLLS